LKLGVVIGPTNWKNWLAFDGDPVQMRSADHFSTFFTIV